MHLVERAEADRPRTARLADRAAVVFLPITLAVAGLGWVVSGSPLAGLAVLVVATPCPLILATPIAFVSGLARAARRGIVVKGGTPLERLGAATVVVFDKTGTLTTGRPRVAEASTTSGGRGGRRAAIRPSAGRRDPRGGRASGLVLPAADDFRESYGDGVEARVGGGRACRTSCVRRSESARPPVPGVAEVWVAVEGAPPE